jgi:predicted TIM-barrel fold metal-dependent hydrolase
VTVTATSTPAPSHLRGRILDCDAHAYIDPDRQPELLGSFVEDDWVLRMLIEQKQSPSYDETRRNWRDTLWTTKGLAAWGSFDPQERVETMDAMGVSQALVFPNTLQLEARADTDEAFEVVRRVNDVGLEFQHATGNRARVAMQINMRRFDVALAEAQRVIAAGATALNISIAYAPGGTSPANATWDPFWALLAETNTVACFHIGNAGILQTPATDPILVPRELFDSPTLKSAFPDRPGSEERVSPIWAIVAPLSVELYLSTMVMGGVLDRHPALRIGAIEFGAQWVGPWVERMDHHAHLLAKVGAPLQMLPSVYVQRNIRVTPYWVEAVDLFIDRYGLEDVYVFSTDFPHIEGGKDPIGKFLASSSRVDDGYVERFFVDNAQLLFPEVR